MGLALRDPKYHTYGDYLTWPEAVRYELIDGDAYLMAPAPTVSHQNIAGEVFRKLANALQGKPCRALIAPVGVLNGVVIQWDELAARLPQPEY